MNIYKKLLILFLIFLGVSFAITGFIHKSQKAVLSSQTGTQKLKTTLSINEAQKLESFDIAGYIGKSALEATKNFAKVEETGTGGGAFVTSIDGKTANPKKHEFWELLVNGKSSEVGAGSYIIQKGDSILWHINTY